MVDVLSIKHEYRIFKPLEITIKRKTKLERSRRINGGNEFKYDIVDAL
jgi:hypothetical protein